MMIMSLSMKALSHHKVNDHFRRYSHKTHEYYKIYPSPLHFPNRNIAEYGKIRVAYPSSRFRIMRMAKNLRHLRKYNQLRIIVKSGENTCNMTGWGYHLSNMIMDEDENDLTPTLRGLAKASDKKVNRVLIEF